MFSFGSKKPAPPPTRANKPSAGGAAPPKQRNLAQLGLLDMGFGAPGMDDGDDDDGDLEAELAMLTKGTGQSGQKKVRKQLVSEQELAAMVSSSLRDIPSDAEVSDVDDAEVEDELNELCAESDEEEEQPPPSKGRPPLAPQMSLDLESKVKALQQRLTMYETAEKNASAVGDGMKARRFGRGVKTLRDMLKQAQLGKSVVMSEMPPPLAESFTVPGKVASPPPAVPKESASSETLPVENTVPLPAAPPVVPTRTAPAVPTMEPVVPPVKLPPIPPRAPAPMLSDEAKSQPIKQSVAPANSVPAELTMAIERRNELKNAALQAKRAGDQAGALQLVRLVKMCDQLISSAQQGAAVDWSLLPSGSSTATAAPSEPIPAPRKVVEEPAPAEPAEPAVVPASPAPQEAPAAIPVPKTTLEALEQRLEKYQSVMQQAQEENNSSKVRRMGRIVKQYQDAIKMCRAGKPVPFDELPDPPGYPPIPGAPRKAEDPEMAAGTTGAPADAVLLQPNQPTQPAVLSPPKVAGGAAIPSVSPKPPPKKTALATRQDKQLALLLERQTMFKTAALEAKRSGEMELAKEYLRMAKGIDPLISANKCGVPVDMDTLPIPPQMKLRSTLSKDGSAKAGATSAADDFVLLSTEECVLAPSLGQESSALFVQLEADLVAQLKTCSDNRDHYKLMGDIANANRFDQLALYTRKDLDVVRSSVLRGDPVPRWKNEMRTFSIVKCCTDLKDDDMEVTILRGLSFNVPNPKTVDTYVKLEAPFPNSENPTREKTNTVKDTNSPEYNETFHINFSRQSRTLLRVFKAKSIKFEVWAKGGFLRSDVLIGTASIKLERLLNHCQIHEAVDLMEGRKPVGGKLEVKVRLRDPIVGKEVEQVQEKWTVLIQ